MTTGRWLAVVALCGCLGCASSKVQQVYTGPRLPMTEVAWLEVPQTMVLLEVNGQAIVRRGFSAGAGVYELRPGAQRFIVQYKDLWPLGEYDHEKVKSEPVLISAELDAGQQYYLAHEQPESIKEARRMAANFKPDVRQKEIISAAANVRAVQVRTAPGTRDEVMSSAADPADPGDPADTAAEDRPEVKVISPLQKLMYWWEKASPEQRKLFIQKVEL